MKNTGTLVIDSGSEFVMVREYDPPDFITINEQDVIGVTVCNEQMTFQLNGKTVAERDCISLQWRPVDAGELQE